jgi:hypothetical protein
MRAPNDVYSLFTVIEAGFDLVVIVVVAVTAVSGHKSRDEGGEAKVCYHLIVIVGKLSAGYLCAFCF